MSVQLYTMPGTIALASHIAIEESGIPYELVTVDFSQQEQLSDSYRKINPKQRVPALIVDGSVLTETPAILTYLAQIAPDSPLGLPEDPLEIARINSFNSYLCSTVHVAHAHKLRGSRWTDDEDAKAALTRFVPVSMKACFDLIESEMVGPWVHGERYSISDPYLFAIAQWLEGDGVDVGGYVKVEEFMERMTSRESVKDVLQR